MKKLNIEVVFNRLNKGKASNVDLLGLLALEEGKDSPGFLINTASELERKKCYGEQLYINASVESLDFSILSVLYKEASKDKTAVLVPGDKFTLITEGATDWVALGLVTANSHVIICLVNKASKGALFM